MRSITLSSAALADLVADLTARGRWVRLRPRGGSMVPTISPGDRVVVAPVDVPSLAPGDIVMVAGAQPFIHRVVGAAAGRLVTRGDACAASDAPVPLAVVVGRIARIERPLAARARRLLAGIRSRLTARTRGCWSRSRSV